MKINEMLTDTIKVLKLNNIDESNIKAKILLSFALNKSKEYLITNGDKEVQKKNIEKYNKYINRLINNEPIQYIIGTQEFMKLNFTVNKNVLIPRQDTEILVEEVINKAKQMSNCKILDLCTGSGAIAVSLKKYIENCIVIASDISCETLKVAKINAQRNKTKIEFIQSNLFENIDNEKFNIIVSNPPYIETEVLETLEKQVRQEPLIALDGGQDGLEFYKRIIDEGYRYLKTNGYLCLEIGYNQKQQIIKMINKNKNYKNIYSKKDLANNDRIIVCQKN